MGFQVLACVSVETSESKFIGSIQPFSLHSSVPSSVAPPISVITTFVSPVELSQEDIYWIVVQVAGTCSQCWLSSLSLFRNLLVVSGAGPNVTYRYVHFCITDNNFIPIRVPDYLPESWKLYYKIGHMSSVRSHFYVRS
ncbi:hypothetical protein LOAG_05182 [Loa loa]|uniref:Uncharacterized protein n=1 Tax=Loa loa TaxID=7209 RepID=A0A1S0U271_LOALO|nr:hypothetical protein LOAG_05182 [Loa loa]EFO23303.1 hypothetical protein LOAG_05182 [Loa loa]